VRRLFESGDPWFAAAETLLIGVAVALAVGLLIRFPARRVLGDDQRAQHTALMAIWGVVAIFGLMAIVRLFGGAAAEAGLTAAGNRLFGAVPDLLVGLVIIALGFIGATATRAVLGRALHDVSPGRASTYGSVAATVVMIIAVLLAVSQVGIQTRLAEGIVLLVVGGVMLAAAVAAGLGARGLAGAFVAGQHIRSTLHVGDEVEVGSVRGAVVNLGATSVRLRCDDGTLAEVPNPAFLAATVRIHTTSETTRVVPVVASEGGLVDAYRPPADLDDDRDVLAEALPDVDDDAPTRTMPGTPMAAAAPPEQVRDLPERDRGDDPGDGVRRPGG
jgi:small-conductance mechanosensitive channel